MLPCIKENSLGIFSVTADQRFLLGEDVFLRTHYPVTMRRFRHEEKVDLWSEDDLWLQIVSGAENNDGNRTFVLYGAAGSGKSEMIRWLEHKVGQTDQRQFVLRISRTELDPVKILQKILGRFNNIELGDAVYHHWEDLRKKPVTLANHLVWACLAKMLPSDNEIIPVSYKLRPIIENNLRLNFSGIDNPDALEGRTAELISKEELEELAGQCSLPFEIDFEQLRFLMARELEKAILGGYNFVETLKAVSQELMAQKGVRPLLLIDDLVQSMNIYSTDLLDYFITMEEGNWDIVLGLTPASFESSKRGKEILSRINNLDTFDDRLIKLWLTDEQGQNSYFIASDNCHLFAEKYLLEYKRFSGFNCGGECSLVESCTALQMEMRKDPYLAPFNPAFLGRIYRELPTGKGKARYFISTLGEILRKMSDGDITGALENYIKREISVDHRDPAIRLMGEAFAPDSARKRGLLKINGNALSVLLGVPGEEKTDIEALVSDLSSIRPHAVDKYEVFSEESLEINTGKSAIRDWLEGRQVNKELLKGLRLGIAHICREIVQPCSIIPPNTARQSSLIKWDESIEGSKIPVVLEGVDSFDGLPVSRDLGHTAYLLNYAHLKRGMSKEQLLTSISQSSDEVFYIIQSAYKYKQKLISMLTGQLGLSVEELAYLLFVLLVEFGQCGNEIPVIIYEKYFKQGMDYQNSMNYSEGLESVRVFFPKEYVKVIKALFKDWFLIRENIYNSLRLSELYKKYRDIDPILAIANIDASGINPQFKIAEMDLGKYIINIQGILNSFVRSIRGNDALIERDHLEKTLKMLEELKHSGIHNEVCGMLSEIATSLDMSQPSVPEWQNCLKVHSKIKRVLRPFLEKNGRVRTESPIIVHRFLIALGQLKKDSNFRTAIEIVDFVHMAVSKIKNAVEELKDEAVKSGLLGHLAKNQKWLDGLSQINFEYKWGLEYLSELSYSAREIAGYKRYLRDLSEVSPYIDHQLVCELDVVVEILKNVIGLELPIGFTERIRLLQVQCETYTKAVGDILNWEKCDCFGDRYLASLKDIYQCISNGNLRIALWEICLEWKVYLENLEQLLHYLGMNVGKEILKRTIKYLAEITTLDSIEIAQSLCNAGTEIVLISNPSLISSQIAAGNNESHIWILDMLLQPNKLGVMLSEISLQELGEFIERFPKLAETINVRMCFL